MNYKEALNLLTPLKEDHILSSFNTLSGTEKKTLLRQVENLDIAQLKIQKNYTHYTRSYFIDMNI